MKFILLLLILLPSFSYGESCIDLLLKLSNELNKRRILNEIDGFNISLYRQKRIELAQQIQEHRLPEAYTGNTPEEGIAFIDAFFESIDRGGKTFEDILENGLNSKQRSILKKANDLFNNEPTIKSTMKLKQFIRTLYIATTLTDEKMLTRRWKDGWSLKRTIDSRGIVAMTTQRMSDALIDLGFHRSTRLQQKFAQWQRTKHILIKTSLSIPFNILPVYKTGIPVYAQPLSLLENTRILDEIIDFAIDNSIDAAYPLLKKEYGNLARFELFYNKIRVMYAIVAFNLYQYFLDDQQLEGELAEILNDKGEVTQRYKDLNMLVDAWAYSYNIKNSNYPSEDELLEYRESLEALGDEKLHAMREELPSRDPSSIKKRDPIFQIKFNPAFTWRF